MQLLLARLAFGNSAKWLLPLPAFYQRVRRAWLSLMSDAWASSNLNFLTSITFARIGAALSLSYGVYACFRFKNRDLSISCMRDKLPSLYENILPNLLSSCTFDKGRRYFFQHGTKEPDNRVFVGCAVSNAQTQTSPRRGSYYFRNVLEQSYRLNVFANDCRVMRHAFSVFEAVGGLTDVCCLCLPVFVF